MNCVPWNIPKSLTWKKEKCDVDKLNGLCRMIPLFKQITVEIPFCRIYQFLQSSHNLHPLKHSLFHE